MTRKIRIATRASELALRQSRIVQEALQAMGVESELVTFKTTGDKNLSEPLSAIGGKGLFTAELEKALLKNKVDCCVHSLKDLPTDSTEGTHVIAVLEREDPRDVLVVNQVTEAQSLAELPAGSRVGTSSLRRRAQLMALRSDLEVVELRGNVPTRVRKVDQGIVHAAILAAAGLLRLGVHQRITQFLAPPDWLPAPGQGAIAVQSRSDDRATNDLLAKLNHSETARSVAAERAFLAALDGGCQVPIGALVLSDGDSLMLHGFISDVRGTQPLRGNVAIDIHAPEESGRALAEDLRARGANSLLLELRAASEIPAPQPE